MASPGIVKAGIAALRVNGDLVAVMGNVSINLGTEKREKLEAATGPVGYKVTAGTPELSCESIKDSTLSLRELAELSGVTITATLRDGTTYSYSQAWAAWDGTLETEDSKMALVFNALGAEEVPAQ